MAVLHAKGLDYESNMRSISKGSLRMHVCILCVLLPSIAVALTFMLPSPGEFKTEDVVAINPRGQAPTFRDGEVIVNESMAAMQYLEEAYPEVPLLPKSVPERAVVYQRMHEAIALQTALTPLFHMGMGGSGDDDAQKVCLARPA